MCVKETHPLPLIKSQVLLFTVIRVEETLMPKNSREADLGEMPQASAGWAARGAQTRTSLSLSWAVRGNIPANPGLYCLTAKCPPGNMADNLHQRTEPKALPDEQGPLGLPVTCSSVHFVLGSPVPPNCGSCFCFFFSLQQLPSSPQPPTHKHIRNLFRHSLLSCSYSSLLYLQLFLSHVSSFIP